MSEESKVLEDHLDDDDWAIIIGQNGNLKGVFIPDGQDEESVPESIVRIMSEHFGVDFDDDNEEESSDGQTIH